MKKINYKSDFDFTLRLKDCEGKEIPFPDCDWDAVFWTSSKANAYTASCKGGQCVNCFKEENGGIHFVFDNHRMGKGTLQWEPHFEFPNGIYPDGIQDRFSKEPLGIELVDGPGECPTTAEVEIMLPYIKGDPFTWEDFTPEQIKELQRPATEAAESVSKLEAKVSQAEALRKDAEQTRISNENSRTSAENDRVRDENIRKANETSRQSDETSRQSNETARVEAETARAEEFAAWQGEIDSKADRSELSNVFAEEPLTPENFPDISTYTREELKKDLFIDMWNSAWNVNGIGYGKYDPVNAPDAEHPFMGNEIWMTYEEAMTALSAPVKNGEELRHCYAYTTLRIRTNICLVNSSDYIDYDLSFFATGQTDLETARITNNSRGLRCKSANSMFSGCAKLTDVFGIMIDLSNNVWTNAFHHCYKLKEVRTKDLRHSISFEDSPLLSLASLQYLVTNASNTSAINITVHANVYAKLSDETNAEWHALLAQAAEKNIIFATL